MSLKKPEGATIGGLSQEKRKAIGTLTGVQKTGGSVPLIW